MLTAEETIERLYLIASKLAKIEESRVSVDVRNVCYGNRPTISFSLADYGTFESLFAGKEVVRRSEANSEFGKLIYDDGEVIWIGSFKTESVVTEETIVLPEELETDANS